MSFERNATEAERRLEWEIRGLPAVLRQLYGPGYAEPLAHAARAWRAEIAARQPAEPPAKQVSQTVERSSVGPFSHARMTTPWRMEWHLPPSLDIARKAQNIFASELASLKPLPPEPPARSISHWGMFHDAA